MRIINKHFDPFMSLVSQDSDTKEFIIVTQEWDREAGNHWARSVDGFDSQEIAEAWLKEHRSYTEIQESI